MTEATKHRGLGHREEQPSRSGCRPCRSRPLPWVKAADTSDDLTVQARRVRDVLVDYLGAARMRGSQGWLVDVRGLAVVLGDPRRSLADRERSLRRTLDALHAAGKAERRRFGKAHGYRAVTAATEWTAVPIGDLYAASTDAGCYVLLRALEHARAHGLELRGVRAVAALAGLSHGSTHQHLEHLAEAEMLTDGTGSDRLYALAEPLACNASRTPVDVTRWRSGKPITPQGRRRRAARAAASRDLPAWQPDGRP